MKSEAIKFLNNLIGEDTTKKELDIIKFLRKCVMGFEEKKKNNEQPNIFNDYDLTEKSKAMVYTWLGYKKEKGQTYKDTGLKTLLKKVLKWQKEFGDEYVVSAVESSISNNYAGLFPAKQQYNNKEYPQQNFEQRNYTKEELNHFDSLDDVEI